MGGEILLFSYSINTGMRVTWCLLDLNPYANTLVKVLHIILLGFVKYFWHNTVACIGTNQKNILITCLSSFNTSGLNLPSLAGYSLVKYAGSLTGCDFRAIAQTILFILHGLGIPDDHLHAWVALSVLVFLVWQPKITEIDQYLISTYASVFESLLILWPLLKGNLEMAIQYFLNYIYHLTSQ